MPTGGVRLGQGLSVRIAQEGFNNILSKEDKEMSYTYSRIEAVWAKATYVSHNAEALGFRKDACGAWINRSAYGDRDNDYGWEIDHIIPESAGGSDYLSNLQPLHWENNVAKGDGALKCVVRSLGANNIR